MNAISDEPVARESLPLLPATTVAAGRFEISYCDVGPKGAPTIVLCHGLASSGRQFSDDALFFVEHGFRVILPDLRGHGRSSVPPKLEVEEFSIPNMAADLIAILDDAGLIACTMSATLWAEFWRCTCCPHTQTGSSLSPLLALRTRSQPHVFQPTRCQKSMISLALNGG